MTMHLPGFRRYVPLFALVPLLCANAAQSDPDSKVADDAASRAQAAQADAALTQRKIAALGPQCTLGNARKPDGDWLMASHAEPGPNQPYVFIYSLDKPVATHAFRAALNAKGLHDLLKVEVRDAAGNWTAVCAGAGQDAPAGCEFVWLEQAFDGGARQVTAVRLSFRPGIGTVTAANVGVLR